MLVDCRLKEDTRASVQDLGAVLGLVPEAVAVVEVVDRAGNRVTGFVEGGLAYPSAPILTCRSENLMIVC